MDALIELAISLKTTKRRSKIGSKQVILELYILDLHLAILMLKCETFR